jgi:hypothetical protein
MKLRRLPPVLDRTPLDDLKWLVAFLGGVLIGFLVFGADAGLLAAFAITAVALVVLLNLIRLWLRLVRPRD